MKNNRAHQAKRQGITWLAGIAMVFGIMGTAQAESTLSPNTSSSTKQASEKAKKERKVAMASKGQVAEPASVAKRAESKSKTRGWHLNLEAVSTLPIDIGGRLTLEMPGRIRLSSSVGVMPAFNADFVNTIMVAAGLYDQQTAGILKTSLQGSMVWRLHLEWRPFAKAGFYLGGGYGMVVLNSRITGASLVGFNLGVPQSILNTVSFNMNSTLHMMSGELGYEFHFFRNIMSLRLAVGFTGTVASSTQIQAQLASTVPTQVRTTVTNAANQAASAFDNMYRQYIFSPTFSVATGFRFF